MTRTIIVSEQGYSTKLSLADAVAPYTPVGIAGGLAGAQALVGSPGVLKYVNAGLKMVAWPSATPGGASLNEVVAKLGAKECLYLPESSDPYLMDTSKGFQRYKQVGPWGDQTDLQLWDEMARLTGGIIGAGPGVTLGLAASSFSRPEQLKSDGGCGTRIFGCSSAGAFVGNFNATSTQELGGLAYHFVQGSKSADDMHFERISFKGAHRGHRNSPGGEAGAFGGLGNRLVASNIEVDCRRVSDQVRVGSSPFMTGGGTGHYIEDSYLHHALAGMPVWYKVGTATAKRVISAYNGSGGGGTGKTTYDPAVTYGLGGSQWNMELCGAGPFLFEGCTFIANYKNNFRPDENPISKGRYPNQSNGNVGAHIGGGCAENSSAVTIKDSLVDYGADGANHVPARFDLQSQPTYPVLGNGAAATNLFGADGTITLDNVKMLNPDGSTGPSVSTIRRRS